MLRFVVSLAIGAGFLACSASHECESGDTQPCGAARQVHYCIGGQWTAECYASGQPSDAESHFLWDAGPRPDAPTDIMDAASPVLEDAPYVGDVFSPGSCTWTAARPQLVTDGPSGGMMLYPLALAPDGIQLAWTALSTNDLRAQEITFAGARLLPAHSLVPPPMTGVAYGSIAQSATRRAMLVGPTRSSFIVPLDAADGPQAPYLPVGAGRCWDLEAGDGDVFTFLCAPIDGTTGVTWHRVDAGSGTMLDTATIAADATDAHRGTLHGTGVEGQFLAMFARAGSVVAQRFDMHGAAMGDAHPLTGDDVRLRAVGPRAIDGGWLVALDVTLPPGIDYGIETITLDVDGRPTRPPFFLPDVRSRRGLASYDLTRAGGDMILVWTQWISGGISDIAMHAQPLSLDGFPRGESIDLGEYNAAGVAPDTIEVMGTPQGALVVYHARDFTVSEDPQLYARALSCR